MKKEKKQLRTGMKKTGMDLKTRYQEFIGILKEAIKKITGKKKRKKRKKETIKTKDNPRRSDEIKSAMKQTETKSPPRFKKKTKHYIVL